MIRLQSPREPKIVQGFPKRRVALARRRLRDRNEISLQRSGEEPWSISRRRRKIWRRSEWMEEEGEKRKMRTNWRHTRWWREENEGLLSVRIEEGRGVFIVKNNVLGYYNYHHIRSWCSYPKPYTFTLIPFGFLSPSQLILILIGLTLQSLLICFYNGTIGIILFQAHRYQ